MIISTSTIAIAIESWLQILLLLLIVVVIVSVGFVFVSEKQVVYLLFITWRFVKHLIFFHFVIQTTTQTDSFVSKG